MLNCLERNIFFQSLYQKSAIVLQRPLNQQESFVDCGSQWRFLRRQYQMRTSGCDFSFASRQANQLWFLLRGKESATETKSKKLGIFGI